MRILVSIHSIATAGHFLLLGQCKLSIQLFRAEIDFYGRQFWLRLFGTVASLACIPLQLPTDRTGRYMDQVRYVFLILAGFL